ncbi:MAG: Uma2 family endonuclease [Myxococcales bacterium]|nr:Uma2 family endonuclease [Myxococcales bacterium]
MAARTSQSATWEDVLALEEKNPDRAFELIDGTIVEKAQPSLPHGEAQLAVAAWSREHFRRGPPGQGGGWVFGTEVDVELGAGRVVRPDVAGWRRERVARIRRADRPVKLAPDWTCEIVSEAPGDRRRDLITKVRLYAEAAVPFYWILDPAARSLTVYRWTESGYLVALTGAGEDVVRASPFEAVEVKVADLLGDEDE